jgi:hypothetical protein
MATTPKAYTATPTLAQWQKDSSIALVRRSDDTVLTRIDTLVDEYRKAADPYVKIQLKADLFFTLDYWLKDVKRNASMNKKREPAVYALYKFTAETLAKSLGTTINVLPEYLERHFGRRLSYHGEHLDVLAQCAIYLTRAEVDKYRLTFRNGKAYMFDWPGKGKEGAEKGSGGLLSLVLADSSTAASPVFRKSTNWGGFAMSMGRELYMARHHCRQNVGEEGNFYHSSYLAGEPVLCAGTIKMKNGIIAEVCNDSGHYRPDARNFIGFLQTLQMHGVNVASVIVGDYSGALRAYGHHFLAAQGNWARAALNGKASVFAANETAKASYGNEKRHEQQIIARMFREAVAAGMAGETREERQFFCERLQGFIKVQPNGARTQPFDMFVNTTWMMEAIDRFYRPAPLVPLQAQRNAPPPPVPKRPGVPMPQRPVAMGQAHGKLPPRRV